MRFNKTKIFLFLFLSTLLTSLLFSYTNDGVYPIYSEHYKKIASNKFNIIGDYYTYSSGTASEKAALSAKWKNNDDGYIYYAIWSGGSLTALTPSSDDIIEGSESIGLTTYSSELDFLFSGYDELSYLYGGNIAQINANYQNYYTNRNRDFKDYKYIMFDIKIPNNQYDVSGVAFGIGVNPFNTTYQQIATETTSNKIGWGVSFPADNHLIYPNMSENDFTYASRTGSYSFIAKQMKKTNDDWYTVIMTTTQLSSNAYALTGNRNNVKFSDIQKFYFSAPNRTTTFYMDNFVLFKDMPNEIKISTSNVTIPANTRLLLSAEAYDSQSRLSAINPPQWTSDNSGQFLYTKGYENYFYSTSLGSYHLIVSTGVYNPESQIITTLTSDISNITVANVSWKSEFKIWTGAYDNGQQGLFTDHDTNSLSVSTITMTSTPESSLKFNYKVDTNGWAGMYIGKNDTIKDLTYFNGIPNILDFKIKLSSNRELMVGIRSSNIDSNENIAKIKLSDLGVDLNSTNWQEVRVLLSNFKVKNSVLDLSKMSDFIIITDENDGSGSYEIKDIKWLSPTIETPTINHNAITSIIKNNSLKIQATVAAKYFTPKVVLHYKLNNGAWTAVNMNISKIVDNSYNAVYNISSNYFNAEGAFDYYIEVLDMDGLFLKYWNNKDVNSPQTAAVVTEPEIINTLIGKDGGTIIKKDSNGNLALTITIPEGALSEDTNITISQNNNAPQLNNRDAVSVYDFAPSPLVFNKPVTIIFSYADSTGDGLVDNLPEGYNNANNLRVYYLNGNKWDLTGGIVNTINKTIEFTTTHFSTYGVFYTVLNKDSYKPNYRILTPNGDGYNDKIIFPNLDNINVEIKIFDVNGRKVRDIKQRPYEWDGKDNFGKTLESGVYIYQFKTKVNNKDEFINGTLAIAK